MPHNRKRIVTGLDDQRRSIIVSDGPVPVATDIGGARSEEHWVVAGMPPALDEDLGVAGRQTFELNPPTGGAVFRLVAIDPGPGEMHVTETLDFVVVLTGEIYLVMEEGEVLLGPGDTVIQRGTQHAWDNRSDEECLLAGILLSALLPPAKAEPPQYPGGRL